MFSLRRLRLLREVAARGSLVALDSCDAYYPLDRKRPPQVGDVIEVELRG